LQAGYRYDDADSASPGRSPAMISQRDLAWPKFKVDAPVS
jgi:hypothetical protein